MKAILQLALSTLLVFSITNAARSADIDIKLTELRSVIDNDFFGEDEVQFEIWIFNFKSGRGVQWLRAGVLTKGKGIDLSQFNSFDLPTWLFDVDSVEELGMAFRVWEQDYRVAINGGRIGPVTSPLKVVSVPSLQASYLASRGDAQTVKRLLAQTIRDASDLTDTQDDLSNVSVINLHAASVDHSSGRPSVAGLRIGEGRYEMEFKVEVKPKEIDRKRIAQENGVPVQVRLESIRCEEEADGFSSLDEGLFAIGLINLATSKTAWVSPRGNAYDFQSFGIVLEDGKTERFGPDTVTTKISAKKGSDLAVVVLAAEGNGDVEESDNLAPPMKFAADVFNERRVKAIAASSDVNGSLSRALDEVWNKLHASKYGPCRKFSPTGRVLRLEDNFLGDGTTAKTRPHEFTFAVPKNQRRGDRDHTANYRVRLSVASLPIIEDLSEAKEGVKGIWRPDPNPANVFVDIREDKSTSTIKAFVRKSDGGDLVEEWSGVIEGRRLRLRWEASDEDGPFGDFGSFDLSLEATGDRLVGGRKRTGGKETPVVLVREK